jgi:RNA polymerase sigma-70 factor (ECF subfamily)
LKKRQQSDQDAEAILVGVYHRHSAAVMAYALRRCHPDDAADVVSETFVVAWRRLDAIPEEPAVKPWLLGVARRVLANQRRGLRRRGELVKKASTYLAPRFHDVSAFEQFGEVQAVGAALETLSPSDRELLMLEAWEELTPTEIATVMGLPGAVVRKRLFRARNRLAAAVDRDGGERSGPSGHSGGSGSQGIPPVTRRQAGTDTHRMGKGVPAQ